MNKEFFIEYFNLSKTFLSLEKQGKNDIKFFKIEGLKRLLVNGEINEEEYREISKKIINSFPPF
ncbi:MAG: hypothetical protein KAU58_02620 [Candidatus Omnitrophica bacterium]|nr:hypothetical protein [Candidatus Omnitrophota bacterium]